MNNLSSRSPWTVELRCDWWAARRWRWSGGPYRNQNFWLLDLTTGQLRQLTNLRPGFDIKSFDVSPDGKEILFDRYRENADLVLIDLPPR